MSAQPWFKFYPNHWRADTALRMCSPSARCLWIEMLCIMHEAEPRGHLKVNGRPLDARALAIQAGMMVDDVASDLAELEANGVFSRMGDGTIISRKMVRETRQSAEQSSRAKSRWTENIEQMDLGIEKPMPKKSRELDIPQEPSVLSGKRARAWKTVPVGWHPNEAHYAKATELCYSNDQFTEEVAKFREWEFKDAKTDADRAFHRWLREGAKRRGENGSATSRSRWQSDRDRRVGNFQQGIVDFVDGGR